MSGVELSANRFLYRHVEAQPNSAPASISTNRYPEHKSMDISLRRLSLRNTH
jgi:hypothetical protein